MAAGSELLKAFATLELRGAREVSAGLASVERQAASTEQALSKKVGGSLQALGGEMQAAQKYGFFESSKEEEN